MGSTLEGELRALLAYYGENPDSPDAPKPEDFFALITSFSSSLQASDHFHFTAHSIIVASRNVPSRFMMQKKS